MNLRALTRGDAAVAGAAVLLFIASFLPYVSADCSLPACSESGWSAKLFPILPSVFLLGIIAAALILVQRLQGEAVANRQVLGLRLDQWGIGLSVAALWTSLWSLAVDTGSSAVGHGLGAWLGLISLLVLAGAAAAGPLVPALQAPLMPEKPAAPQGYAPYAGAPGVHPGQQSQQSQQGQQGQPQYGYPGGTQAGQHDPTQASPYGAQAGTLPLPNPQGQQGGYGYPAAAQPQDQVAAAAPTQVQPPVQAAAPAAPFAAFWFAVPTVRPLSSKDNPAGPAVGELVPGTWYLAVDQRGAALVAQLQDGTQGLLNDTAGIQRG